ncbi:hypothetical protein [Leptospira kanakyensis]|uniref:Uncharacterized protein n=1 Tax=Leptospira kanakyensis TaxID=2484968 RepID=A0A6N4Q181_9LEPT|nr:hypothetical protein [Leptospira kanakyensis]TGK51126.1 hypothetical protein EHQ11_09010 [Leptospira kanakyensis]TGK70622.1 hypothetical protein EHQ18_09230 [Leptospira kanakyensis]
MGLLYSKTYPYIIALLCSILSYKFSSYIPYPNIPTILPQTMTFGGIIVGFFATTLTILYSIDESKTLIKKIKKADYYDLIVSYLFQTIYSGFILASISTAGLFMNFQIVNIFDQIYFSIWVFTFISSLLLSFRIIRILGKILSSN